MRFLVAVCVLLFVLLACLNCFAAFAYLVVWFVIWCFVFSLVICFV